jgi:integrase
VNRKQVTLGEKITDMDFSELCRARLEDLEIRRSKGYYNENKTLFSKLMKIWGGHFRITTDNVERYLMEVARRSKPVANKHLRLIKALFNHGITRHWFFDNPARGIAPFGLEKKRKYIPSHDDIHKVMNIATEEQRRYLTVIAMTLARVREINNLRWEDVDLEDRYLVLRTRKAKNSDVAERKIPMTDTVKEILASLPRNGEFVFMNPRTGKRYEYRKRFIRSLCVKAKVRPFMYHALRHYGASKLAKEGVPLTDIQEILGHQRASTTDLYLQSIRGSLRESIKKLDE